MADDLASRISDGAVAVIELVPGEQRFADLSNHVLRGGASRFAPVVLDDERVRYVLPVGIPGDKLDYGTLLIQKSRCALVWRTDPTRPYRALVTDLSSATTVAQSPVTVHGEVWGRFDLRRPGTADMTFLVPPVESPALPRMLHRVLVDEPGCRQGRIEVVALPAAVLDAPPADPVEVAPPAVAVPVIRTVEEHAPSAAIPAAPVVSAPVVSALSAPPEAPAPARAAGGAAPAAPEIDPYATQPMAAVDAPKPLAGEQPTWTPRRPEPAPEPPAALDLDHAIYRPESRTMPVQPSPRGVPARPTPSPSASRGTAPIATRRRIGDGLKGFLTGFTVTVVVGGLYLLAKVLGWL